MNENYTETRGPECFRFPDYLLTGQFPNPGNQKSGKMLQVPDYILTGQFPNTGNYRSKMLQVPDYPIIRQFPNPGKYVLNRGLLRL